jgi:hypothetical protein
MACYKLAFNWLSSIEKRLEALALCPQTEERHPKLILKLIDDGKLQ